MGTFIQFFAGLSILIILHELGHFLAAKYFGVRVEKFYLFFDFLFPLPDVAKFSLFKKKIGDTEYGIGWFPFGGYVQMAGIMDENMDREALEKPVQPHEFRAKPAWQRLIILLGGIIMNVLVAFIFYSIIAGVWGDSYIKVEDQTYGLYVDSLGQSIGLKNGDIITHVNGKKVERVGEDKMEMILSIANNITYLRNGQEGQIEGIPKSLYATMLKTQDPLFEMAIPSIIDSVISDTLKESGVKKGDRIIEFEGQAIEFQQELLEKKKNYGGKEVSFSVLRNSDTLNLKTTLNSESNFGFIVETSDFKETKKKYGFLQAIAQGPIRTWGTLSGYLRQMKLIFDSEIKGYKQIGGFGTIAKIYSGGFSWAAFLAKTAFISVMLAFMNLLPIPALDGGHALFTIYEMIFRKPPPEKFLYYAQIVGMAILFGLLIYANGMDLIRHFFGK